MSITSGAAGASRRIPICTKFGLSHSVRAAPRATTGAPSNQTSTAPTAGSVDQIAHTAI